MNPLDNIWKWLKKVFSLPKADDKTPETPKTDKPKVEPTKTDTPKVEKPPIDPPKSDSGTTEKPLETPSTTKVGPIQIDPDYASKKGYNPDFLGFKLPLPKVSADIKKQLAIPAGQDTPVLNYHHYSLIINEKRKMPQFTAVNMDAVSYNKIEKQVPSRSKIGRDKWFLDPRIPKTAQLDDDFYKDNDFDIGHMVRREDAVWGDTLEQAIKANNDTFHLTNACPQHKDFNRNAKRWLGLEDYAIKNARKNDLRITVFTGPVLLDDDKKFNNIAIPATFWKIIIMVKEDGTPSATGYIIRQNDLIKDMVNLRFEYGAFETYQVKLSEIEGISDLKFGLNDHDPLQKINSLVYEPKKIEGHHDIVF
jgi:endonuclease G, mitochondrial